VYKVLTIAGSDSSGGAGIQADIKTITVHHMYALSVVTALTAQNTLGVMGIQEAEPSFVGKQLDAVFTDIVPDALKIGMVSGREIIRVIAERLQHYAAQNIVVDPVMVSTSRHKLLSDAAQSALISELLPLARLITPNIPESEALCGFPIRTEAEMIRAGQVIQASLNGAVLIKGGHLLADAADLLYDHGRIQWFRTAKIANPNTHGTGCTLSSAIACHLAEGKPLAESIQAAKEYLTGAIAAQLNLGQGFGPLDHMYRL
jgi:hydroxymethylpyrimidine/phosphomethylpyrimidine kinase